MAAISQAVARTHSGTPEDHTALVSETLDLAIARATQLLCDYVPDFEPMLHERLCRALWLRARRDGFSRHDAHFMVKLWVEAAHLETRGQPDHNRAARALRDILPDKSGPGIL